MAANYDFRILNTRPAATGWTSATITAANQARSNAEAAGSAVGPVNAAAQANVSADLLRTTPSTLSDPTLGSRAFENPNTGVRDVAASGSVYNMSNVPAYLSQAVNSLNSEQTLQRSIQAEWNNRLMQNAQTSSDPYIWLEAIRAASVGPGSSVSFGQQIADPNQGHAALTNARVNAILSGQKAQTLANYNSSAWNIAKAQSELDRTPAGSGWNDQRTAAMNRLSSLTTNRAGQVPVAVAAAGGTRSPSGWGPSVNYARPAWF